MIRDTPTTKNDKSMRLRLPSTLYERIRASGKAIGRSVNYVIVRILTESMDKTPTEPTKEANQ